MYKILVGSYSDEITTLVFDPDTNKLEIVSTVKSGQSPSWIALHPTDRSLLFATNEVTEGKVQLFRISGDGSLQFVDECASGGADPASLAITECSVIVANYSSGTILPIPLTTSSPYLLEPRQGPILFEGSGPNKNRQEASHPHQVIFHRDELLVPDLGTDKTWRLKEEEGKWNVVGSLAHGTGKGPRHAVIHNDVLYTTLELANEVDAHALPPLPQEPTLLSELSSLPPGSSPTPDTYLAEIALSPSTAIHPLPLLYVTNRNEPLPSGDTITVYSPYGAMGHHDISGTQFHYLNSIPTGLQHLRSITLGGPDSHYLIAGGVHGGGAKVFERNGTSLKEVARVDIEKPACFVWL